MKFLRDSWIIFVRFLQTSVKMPIWLVFSLFQPLLYLFLFAPLLQGIGSIPGFPPNSTMNIFVPGLLVMLALFGSSFVGFGLIDLIRSGFIDRLLVTPVDRRAIMAGIVARDVLVLIVQSSLLTLVAIPMGLKINPAGFILALGFVILIAITMASFSYALALAFKDENSLASTINFFTAPILLLSGITLPLTFAPRWINIVADFNPFKYTVDAMRSLFFGQIGNSDVWTGYIILIIFASLMFRWALNNLRKMAA